MKKPIIITDHNGIQHPNCPRCGSKWKRYRKTSTIICSSYQLKPKDYKIFGDDINDIDIFPDATCIQAVLWQENNHEHRITNSRFLALCFKLGSLTYSVEWYRNLCSTTWKSDEINDWEHSSYRQGLELPTILPFNMTVDKLKTILTFK